MFAAPAGFSRHSLSLWPQPSLSVGSCSARHLMKNLAYTRRPAPYSFQTLFIGSRRGTISTWPPNPGRCFTFGRLVSRNSSTSLVWPLLLITSWYWKSRRTTILCALSATSLIYSSIASFHDPVAAFYSPLSRLWELGAGGILASRNIKVRYPEIISLLGVTIIVIAGSTMTSQMVFPGLLATIPVGGTAMVIVGRSRLLSWRPLVALGLISYPFYLWHSPLLSFAAILNFHTELAKALVVVASGFLAWLTTRYVEYPIRFGILRSRGAALSLAGTLAVSLGAFLIFYFSGVPQRYPEEIRPVLATKDEQYLGPARRGLCWITYEEKFKDYAPECREGETLVWGDSYSAMLVTGLPKPYAQFSHDRCQPLLIGGEDPCALENAAVADEILRLKPKRVILFGRWQLLGANWLSDPKLNEALRQTLKKLRSGITDVILVGPAPEWWPNLRMWFSDFGNGPAKYRTGLRYPRIITRQPTSR
jgi:hypothetical protein